MRLLSILAAGLCLSACATSAPRQADSYLSSRAASDVRDCLVFEGSKAGVTGGRFDFKPDGGLTYASTATGETLVDVSEEGAQTRIRLNGADRVIGLPAVVRGCS